MAAVHNRTSKTHLMYKDEIHQETPRHISKNIVKLINNKTI